MRNILFRMFILFTLSILLCGCAPMQENMQRKSLNEYLISSSINMTCTMDSLAQSAEYIALISGPIEVAGLTAEIGADDYRSPNQAVLITVPAETVDAVIKSMMGEIHLPDDAYEEVVARMLLSIPNMINAQRGSLNIAAAALLSANKVLLQHKDLTATAYVVLVYDNRSSVTVFRNSADGIVSASSTFLFPNDELNTAIAGETVFDYFSELFNVSEFEVEYVAGNTIADYPEYD